MCDEGGTKMPAEFSNVYDDQARAQAYAELEFPGTYFLAYRDLPAPLKTYRPLAKRTEPSSWVSETTIAPWVIYVLGRPE